MTIGALVLGESHAFGPEQGAPVRVSLHLVLAALVVLDGWFDRRGPQAAAMWCCAAALAALLLTAGAALLSRQQVELAVCNAAVIGWAGGQLALLLDRWRAARASGIGRLSALALPLVVAAVALLNGRGAAPLWSSAWVGLVGLALGACAWYGALRLDPSPPPTA